MSALSNSAMAMAETIVTIPGSMKLWFSRYSRFWLCPSDRTRRLRGACRRSAGRSCRWRPDRTRPVGTPTCPEPRRPARATTTAAAALKSMLDSPNRPTANVHGWSRTRFEMPSTRSVRLPSKKEEPSQDTPMMEIIAVMPLRMTVPFTAFCGEAPNSDHGQPGNGDHRDHDRGAHAHLIVRPPCRSP